MDRLKMICFAYALTVLALAQWVWADPISNGSFERMKDDTPVGWKGYDQLGLGHLEQDLTIYRSGSASLRLSQILGIYGIGSEKLPFYPWEKSITVSSWVKASQAGRFHLWLIWFNHENVVKIKRILVDGGTYDWKQIVLTDTQPPQGAGRYQVICAGESGAGSVWVDDVAVNIASHPRTDILVNQIGYRIGWPKTFLVQSTQPLSTGTFEILSSTGNIVRTGSTVPASTPRGWSYYYLRGDFSSVDTEGTYRVRLQPSGLISYSFRISANPYAKAEDLARQFFYYQRCGAKITGWHSYCHLDDGNLDGTHIPIIGGWHDAGDYIKTAYGEPLSFFALSRLASQRVGMSTYQKLLDESKWGAVFLTQLIDPSTGRLLFGIYNRQYFWGRPEDETDGIPGNGDDREILTAPIWSTDNQLAAAGFAILSPLAARTDYLDRARSLWQRVCSAEPPVDAQNLGRLVILDTLLYAQTGEVKYRDQAQTHVNELIALQNSDGSFPRYNLTDRGVGAAGLAYWAASNPTDSSTPMIRKSLRRYLRSVTSLNRNAFGVQPYDSSTFFFPYDGIDAWKVGENSDYLSVAWAAALAGKSIKLTAAYKSIIQNHLDWIMGKNPFGVCMIQGMGSYNPQFYHHRYDKLPGHSNGAVPGAIPNGLTRESIDSPEPRFDILGNSYETNEPWLPHNCFFLLTMSELFP